MGMHHGILVASASLDATIRAADAHLPSLRLGAVRGPFASMELEDREDGWHMAAGELEGRSYVLDTSMMLSADGDAIVGMSAELGCLVIGCGEETVSGSYWFYAADRGRLLRGYYNCYSDMQAPWSQGESLATESESPLEHLDGEGLMAALRSFGFDYDRWVAGSELRELIFDLQDFNGSGGPLAMDLEAFKETVAIPAGKQPKPKVVRRDAGFDLAPGEYPVDGPTGLLGFVLRLLGAGGSGKRTPLPGTPPPSRPAPASAKVPTPRTASMVVPMPQKAPDYGDLPPAPHNFYMEYVGGASSKFYAVAVEEEDGGAWRVRFNFGRIGFPRAWANRVEGAPWRKAIAAYMGLVDEKMGKGYEPRPWPRSLQLPDGGHLDVNEAPEGDASGGQTLFHAATKGVLPPAAGGIVAGVPLPEGQRWSPTSEGGNRGDGPVIWGSIEPVKHVDRIWAQLAAVFPETGLWPVVIDAAYGFRGFDDYLMDTPRGRHKEVAAILRKAWSEYIEVDDDEAPEMPENTAPYGRTFPGLAAATPGARPTAASIGAIVAGIEGHLGLVAVNRPADVLDAIGWQGAANYDGQPLDMSTVLRSWETRFDAYLVGLGTDTLNLAVGRPPTDPQAALAIAAEHFAFCPDNIDQGAGSIGEYAALLLNAGGWAFWWD